MLQVVRMTEQAQIALYKKMKKKDIIEMLIECNKQLDSLLSNKNICEMVELDWDEDSKDSKTSKSET